MIPSNYIRVLVDCYIEADTSGEFWKLSGIVDELMDYDSSIMEDYVDSEFQDVRLCMMKHFKHREEHGAVML